MSKDKIIVELMEIESLIEMTDDKGEQIKLKKQWTKLHNKLKKIVNKEVE